MLSYMCKICAFLQELYSNGPIPGIQAFQKDGSIWFFSKQYLSERLIVYGNNILVYRLLAHKLNNSS